MQTKSHNSVKNVKSDWPRNLSYFVYPPFIWLYICCCVRYAEVIAPLRRRQKKKSCSLICYLRWGQISSWAIGGLLDWSGHQQFPRKNSPKSNSLCSPSHAAALTPFPLPLTAPSLKTPHNPRLSFLQGPHSHSLWPLWGPHPLLSALRRSLTVSSGISLRVHDKSQPLEKEEEKVHLDKDGTPSLQTCLRTFRGDPETVVLLYCTG